jgi:2',3'-cyclic-nucleotide 2'-phosphodiesterase (5'-nucleotidase family)
MPSAPRSRACSAVGRALIVACVSLACSRSKTLPSADSAPSSIASASAPAPRIRPDVALFFLSSLRGHVESDGTGPKSGGLARAATLIDRGRIDARGVVIVDAGDFLPSRDDGADAGAALDQRVKLVAASYKRMGVDIVTLGEREIALGLDRLRAVLRTGHLRAVAANLVTKRGEPAFDDEPIVEAAGVPVGVFGIVELAPDSAQELEQAGLATTDGVEAARAAVRALRDKGAAFVIGLLHVAGGSARASEIATKVDGIDVAVLGHASGDGATREPLVVGRTRVVYAGADGSRIGRVDLRVSDAGAPRVEDTVLAVDGSISPHPGVGLLAEVEVAKVRVAEEKAAAAERRKKGQKEPDNFEVWNYASEAACAYCHAPAVAQWKTTEHADAMATLKKKGHDHDPSCIGCHTTGYLLPGGTRYVETAVEKFADVGCECCHGPSAPHVRSLDKKKGTSRKVGAEVCLGCHTPDQNVGTFDYESAVASIIGPGHGAPLPDAAR